MFLLALALLSCTRGPSTFVEARNAIDAALAKAAPAREREAAFAAAQRLAHTSTEWLSLLRRGELSEKIAPAASGGADWGRAARVADAALRSMPLSADLRFAAAHAYLRSRPSRPEKAIGLFGADFKPDSEPELFAEAFLPLYRDGRLPSEWRTAACFGLVARSSGMPGLYLDAAALAAAAGDSFSGSAWLRLAEAAGHEGPDSLLWSLGLYRELAARDDSGAGPERLRLLGDAAWLSGQRGLAVRRWQLSLPADSKQAGRDGDGWKSFASLGVVYEADEAAALERAASLGAGSGKGQTPDGAPSVYIDIPDPASVYAADTAAQAARARTAACYATLIADYPANLGAAAVYSERLARTGRPAEGLSLLEKALDEKGSAARGAAAGSAAARGLRVRALKTRLLLGGEVWSAGAFASEALKTLEQNPGDTGLIPWVLQGLLEKGRYADFCDAEKKNEKQSYPDSWYYKAVALMLRGRNEDARALIEERGKGKSEPAASFALGRVCSLEGDYAASAAAYKAALSAARTEGERCAALKGIGRAREKLGDGAAARVFYLAAHDADPSDIEAALLSRNSQ